MKTFPSLREPALRSQGLNHLRRADPILGPHIGPDTLRYVVTKESIFTHLLRIIIAQQVSVAAANAITARVLACCRQQGGIGAQHLIACNDEQLLSCGLSRPKLGYLQDLAHGLREGRHQLQRLATLSDDEAIARLCAIRGIGTWSAHMVLMFRLHRPDILPTLDIGLRRALERLYHLDPNLSAKAFHQAATAIAEPWRPFRALATRYLWAASDGDITY